MFTRAAGPHTCCKPTLQVNRGFAKRLNNFFSIQVKDLDNRGNPRT